MQKRQEARSLLDLAANALQEAHCPNCALRSRQVRPQWRANQYEILKYDFKISMAAVGAEKIVTTGPCVPFKRGLGRG